MNKIKTLGLAVALLAGAGAQAQVISHLNEQATQVPMAPKDGQQGKKRIVLDPKVQVDTTTRYFQLVDSAQHYISAKDYSSAEAMLRKAIGSEPSNPNNSLLISNLATLQRYQGNYAAAVKNYTLALDMTPNAVALLLNRAALYVQIDSLRLARADYERIVSLDPSEAEAHYNLGMLALEAHDFKGADAQFDEILRYHPNAVLASEGKGFLNKASGNYAKAAQCFSEVIKVRPTASLLANRADCYLTMKRLNDASDDINTALEMDKDDGYLYLLRAKLNKLRYEEEAAKRDVQLAIDHGVDADTANNLFK